MSQGYIGEIRMFAGFFNPVGWEFCRGQLLPISENEALFTLIGTTYGGDGQSTFALPDLRCRVPIHQGTGGGGIYQLAQSGGTEDETLTVNQIPVHNHALIASTSTATTSPTNAFLTVPTSSQQGVMTYNNTAGVSTVQLQGGAVQPQGGSQPHTNMQPYLCINFIISLYGVFPQQT